MNIKIWLRDFLGISKIANAVKEIDVSLLQERTDLQSHINELQQNKKNLELAIVKSNTEIQQYNAGLVSSFEKTVASYFPEKRMFDIDALQLRDKLDNVLLDFKLLKNMNIDRFKTHGRKISNLSLLGTSAAGVGVFDGIANNIYTCSTASSNLMKIGNGYGSAVMGKSGIVGQTPFIPAGVAAFTPVLAIYAVSMMTVNSRLDSIEREMEKLNQKMDLLIFFHDAEQEAKLQYISDKLVQFNGSKYFTIEDFILLENFKFELSIMKSKFDKLIQYSKVSVLNSESTDNELQSDPISDTNETNYSKSRAENAKDTVKKGFQWTANKFKDTADYLSNLEPIKNIDKNFIERFRNSKVSAEKLEKKLKNSNLLYFVSMSVVAEKLLHQCQFLEIKMNLSKNDPSADRVQKTNILIQKFREQELSDHSFSQLKELESIETTILPVIQEKFINSDWNRERIGKIEKNIKSDIAISKELIQVSKSSIEKIQNSLSPSGEIEMAIEIKDGVETIYMLEKGTY